MKAALFGLALLATSLTGAAAPLCGTAYAESCCKKCSKGKACGDTCIPRDHNCSKGKGCACDA